MPNSLLSPLTLPVRTRRSIGYQPSTKNFRARRILIVGAFGSRLAQAGRDVTFLVRPSRARHSLPRSCHAVTESRFRQSSVYQAGSRSVEATRAQRAVSGVLIS